jgi:putative peptidoglycan lipid II flippase
VFAPTVNNVVVITAYLIFGAMRGGQPPSLELTTAEKLVLALGTTLGVVAFCAVPVVGLWRTGFHVRPRLRRDPVLRRVARSGAWAAGFLALTQALLVVVLYLANGVEGGVVVYQLAYVLFMLPHALFSVPLFTTAFPALARLRNAGDWDGFGEEVARAARSIALFTLFSAGALVALSAPLAALVARGNAAGNVDQVAGAIAGFAIGLPGFSFMLFLTRASYADGDTRSPTVANLVVATVGATTMFLLASRVGSTERVSVLGLGYSIAQLTGAATLAVVVRHRLHRHGASVPGVVVPCMRLAVAAVAGGAAGWACTRLVGPVRDGSAAAALPIVLGGGLVVAVVALAVLWVLGGPTPVRVARSLGGDPGRHPGAGRRAVTGGPR